MRKRIIGRVKEQERLDECMRESSAQLVIVYGRRRVGKTFLVNEYFDNRFTFKLTGAHGQPKEFQLRNFAAEMRRKTGKKQDVPQDWIQAFEFLREYLESQGGKKKQVVFLDEMPWLDTRKSRFLPAFEWFWNDWGSTRKNLVLIVCGSATSWMVEKIADNKGGLFNRQTCRLYLQPFKLFEVEAFLKSRHIQWSRYDIAECYMAMGGIPYYLNLLSPKLSCSQNIDRLFFQERGELWDEFDHLYSTLFTNSAQHVHVVEVLAKKKSGLSRNEIIHEAGMPSNGELTKVLNNLVSSGFVRISKFYGRKKKDARYQLADYYTAFYFRFIRGHYGRDEHYWSNAIDSPSRRAWAGLTFEQLCKDHMSQIKRKLGIAGVLSEASVWSSREGEGRSEQGAQVDLVIDRRDRVVNLCEMKFSLNEYTIDKAYDAALRNKIDAFRAETGCRSSLQVTMITTFGVKNNKYGHFAQSQVVLDDLFEE